MFDKTIQIISGTVFAIISYMYGEFDGMMQALLFCMIIDYITGLIAAYKKKEISSKMGFIGLARKFVMLLVVAIGHVLDAAVFSDAMFIKSAVCGFYVANEGISILENTAEVGVPYPDIIIKALKQLNPDKKKEGEDMNNQFVEADANIDADFCFKVKGDDMHNAQIYDGDTVFVKQQSFVENGDIAAVVINDEITLKRVYNYPEKDTFMLCSANPDVEPLIYTAKEMEKIKIIGKVVKNEHNLNTDK